MEIQGQRPLTGVAGLGQLPVVLVAKTLIELYRSGIGSVAGTGLIVTAQQIGVEDDGVIHAGSGCWVAEH